MAVSGSDKIVSVESISWAKVNKNKKTRKIRVKKERKKEQGLYSRPMGHTETCWVKPSNKIYEIHAYFINKALNACKNLKCNNIFNLDPFTYFEFT